MNVSNAIVPPPLPLYSFNDIDNPTVPNTLTGNPIQEIVHIKSENSVGDPINIPIFIRLLMKWFMDREIKEIRLRNIFKSTIINPDEENKQISTAPIVDDKVLNNSIYDKIIFQFHPFSIIDNYTDNNMLTEQLELQNRNYITNDTNASTDVISQENKINNNNNTENSLVFDSDFESGNLETVIRVFGRQQLHLKTNNINSNTDSNSNNYYNNYPPMYTQEPSSPTVLNNKFSELHIPLAADQEYDLLLRKDINTGGHTQWYYFSITPPSPTSDTLINYPMTIRLNIINLYKKDALYNYGMKPLVYSLKDARNKNIGWKHTGYDICYYRNNYTYTKGVDEKKKIQRHYTLTFTYTFNFYDTVYFAHCYPYTYSTLQTFLKSLELNTYITSFYRRKILTTTIVNNNCDLITITEVCNNPELYAKRPAIVISARVHPGESNSSFMMQGLIEFLTSDSVEAKELRETFVFKLIPMLNPDGVIHGNYRCSLSGTDLNRCYRDPHPTLHPTIFAIKSLLTTLHEKRGILLYIDLHGHSRKKNSFLYGCDVALQPLKLFKKEIKSFKQDISTRRVYSRIFPKMLSSMSNSETNGYFSFQDCSFRVQKSKLGTGRVVAWKDLGIEGSFTIEISFCGNGDNNESKVLKKMNPSAPIASSTTAGGSSRDVRKNLVVMGVQDDPDGVLEEDDEEEEEGGGGGEDDLFRLLREDSADNGSVGDDEASLGYNEREEIHATTTSTTTPRATRRPVSSKTPETKTFDKLKDGYKSAVHYTQQDLLNMGRDLGHSLLYFCNKRTTYFPPTSTASRYPSWSKDRDNRLQTRRKSITSIFKDITAGITKADDAAAEACTAATAPDSRAVEVPGELPTAKKSIQDNSGMFAGSSTSEHITDSHPFSTIHSPQLPFSTSDVKVELLEQDMSFQPILRPAIFSVEAIRSTLSDYLVLTDNTPSASPYPNNISRNSLPLRTSIADGASAPPPMSLRMQSEMFIRRALHDEYYTRVRHKTGRDKFEDQRIITPTGSTKETGNASAGAGAGVAGDNHHGNSDDDLDDRLDPLANGTAEAEEEFYMLLCDEGEHGQEGGGNEGSDSDPSGDNIPISKLLRSKAFKRFSERVNLNMMHLDISSNTIPKAKKKRKKKVINAKRVRKEDLCHPPSGSYRTTAYDAGLSGDASVATSGGGSRATESTANTITTSNKRPSNSSSSSSRSRGVGGDQHQHQHHLAFTPKSMYTYNIPRVGASIKREYTYSHLTTATLPHTARTRYVVSSRPMESSSYRMSPNTISSSSSSTCSSRPAVVPLRSMLFETDAGSGVKGLSAFPSSSSTSSSPQQMNIHPIVTTAATGSAFSNPSSPSAPPPPQKKSSGTTSDNLATTAAASASSSGSCSGYQTPFRPVYHQNAPMITITSADFTGRNTPVVDTAAAATRRTSMTPNTPPAANTFPHTNNVRNALPEANRLFLSPDSFSTTRDTTGTGTGAATDTLPSLVRPSACRLEGVGRSISGAGTGTASSPLPLTATTPSTANIENPTTSLFVPMSVLLPLPGFSSPPSSSSHNPFDQSPIGASNHADSNTSTINPLLHTVGTGVGSPLLRAGLGLGLGLGLHRSTALFDTLNSPLSPPPPTSASTSTTSSLGGLHSPQFRTATATATGYSPLSMTSYGTTDRGGGAGDSRTPLTEGMSRMRITTAGAAASRLSVRQASNSSNTPSIKSGLGGAILRSTTQHKLMPAPQVIFPQNTSPFPK